MNGGAPLAQFVHPIEAAPRTGERTPMKPTRKLRRGSFVMRVSGGNPSGIGEPGGQGQGGVMANDHDLGQPGAGHGGGSDPDSGPEAKR